MKKFLSIFAGIALVGPAVISVVACGPQPMKDVLFLLPGDTMKSNEGPIPDAYRAAVNDFNNSEEMKGSNVHVRIAWEQGNPIERRLSSREQLPDLYLANADLVSNYTYNPNTIKNARDMEKTYYGDEENSTPLKDMFWNDTFYNEGVIDGKLMLLPLNKSFEMSVLNLRIFLEIINLVNPDETTKIVDRLVKETNREGLTLGQIFDHENFSVSDELKTELNDKIIEIANSDDIEVGIRTFFKKAGNIMSISKIYQQLYIKNRNNGNKFGVDSKEVTDTGKMYSIGFDSTSNRVFLEYGDRLEDASKIDPQKTTDFFYNVNNLDYNKQKMNVKLDYKDSKTFKDLSNYFNDLGKLAKESGAASGGDNETLWSGSAHIKGKHGNYSSNVYTNGNFMLTSSSSAGTAHFNNPRANNYVKNRDLIAVSTSTISGNYFDTIVQGPGLAGFKSVGSNASEKEKVTTKFVRYLLKARNLNRLAIAANYIPSTTDALNIYKHYKNGDYDNINEQWNIKAPEGIDEKDYGKIKTGTDIIDQKDILIDQWLNDFILPGAKTPIHFVGTVANPAGTVIRDSIEISIENHFIKNRNNFEGLLTTDKKDQQGIIYRFKELLPGALNLSTIEIRKEN